MTWSRSFELPTKDAVRRYSRPSGWTLSKQVSSVAPANVWSNADQDPVPPERRTWTAWTFVLYWFSDLVTVSTWSQGSSVVAAGLSATDAMLICFVASLCNAVPIVLNGAIGSNLHIPFPIAARAAYGYWLSYFAVVSRGVLALFWFGVNSAGRQDPADRDSLTKILSWRTCSDTDHQVDMAFVCQIAEPSSSICRYNNSGHGVLRTLPPRPVAVFVYSDAQTAANVHGKSNSHATSCNRYGGLDCDSSRQ